MPVAVLAKLCGVIDPALLSLLLPDGYALVRVDALSDPAALASGALDYLGLYSAARHPESELGTEIGPSEAVGLEATAARLRAVDGRAH